MNRQTKSSRLTGDSSSPGVVVTQVTNDNEVNPCLILELPIPILLEIFFRIPTKSIMLCKCVCTAFRMLLSDPEFTDSYAKSSKFTALLCSPAICSGSFRTDTNLHLLEISDATGCMFRKPIDLTSPNWPKMLWDCSFVGCSNGLICLSISKSNYSSLMERYRSVETMETTEPSVRCSIVRVFNPFMGGGFITLPECEATVNYRTLVKYVFGFNPSGNNYKVLRFGFKAGGPGGFLWVAESHIITVGADNEWRSLPDRFVHHNSEPVVEFGGVFNWIPWLYKETTYSISTFHLGEEKAGQIPLPPDVVVCKSRRNMELRIIDKMFSLVDLPDQWEINVWAMKKYAVAESWTKSVITLSWVPSDDEFSCFCPIVKLQDGWILFEDAYIKGLVSFTLDKNRGCNIHLSDEMQVDVQCAPNFFARVEDL